MLAEESLLNIFPLGVVVFASFFLILVCERLSTSIYKTFENTKELKDYNSLTTQNLYKTVSLEKNIEKVLQATLDRTSRARKTEVAADLDREFEVDIQLIDNDDNYNDDDDKFDDDDDDDECSA